MCDYLRSAPLRRVSHPLEESPIWDLFGSVVVCLVAFLISFPMLLTFILILPITIFIRGVLYLLHRHRLQSGLGGERMRANESRWLGDDWNKSVVCSTLIFDSQEGLTIDQFRRIFTTRILPVYPRLTRLPVTMPISAGGGYCWLPDTSFSVTRHIVEGPDKMQSFGELNNHVSTLLQNGLSKDKPPWEFQVIRLCGEQRDTIVVARVHQSIADGTSLLRVLCHSLADSQAMEIFERPQYGCFAFGLNVFRACLTGPFTLLVWLCLSAGDRNPLTRHCTWSGSLTVSWSASIALPKVIRIKQVTRSTVNCVVLSALAGALRKLLKGCGVRRPPNVKVMVPLDLRSQPSSKANSTALGNKSTSLVLSLPVSLEGCIPRLWATRRTLAALHTSSDPILLYIATAVLMSVTPASTARYLLDLLVNKTSLQFSCLPGPSSHLTVGGERLKQMYCLVPAPSHVGISITVVTYADQVHVSVVAERALGPTAQLLLDYLENQVEILWTLLLHRRVPGEGRACCIPITPEIITSPVQEIETRLALLQKEVMLLTSDSKARQERKLALLKAEFTQLVGELKRRQSSSDTEREENLVDKGRRRTASCSFPSKQASKTKLSIRPTSTIISVEESAVNENFGRRENSQRPLKGSDKDSNRSFTLPKLADCMISTDPMRNAEIENYECGSFTVDSGTLCGQKHRKNSFEIIRDRNKRREFQRTALLSLPLVSEQCNDFKDSKTLDKTKEIEQDRVKDSGSEIDTETDYSDTTIKISDDEIMDLDYDDLKNSGPISKNLRDLYCSNYLDHKLTILRGEERRLSQQMSDNLEFYRAIDDNDPEGGLLI